MDNAVQLDLFKPYHPCVDVYFQPVVREGAHGIKQTKIWGLVRVSETDSVEDAFKQVEGYLRDEGTQYKKPLFGFIRGGRYGAV